jgi:AAA domain
MAKRKPPEPLHFADLAAFTPGRPVADIRRFDILSDGHYRWTLMPPSIVFELRRVHRDHQELKGELSVACDIPGARTVAGVLSTGDLNLSSARAKADRAKLLADRARTGDAIDWTAYVEEFCLHVFQADGAGTPPLQLHEAPLPEPDALLDVAGLRLLKYHPTILFGDGGTGKSYLALYVLGQLAAGGLPVLYLDWELDASEHRARLERLYPDGPPTLITYLHCVGPLVHELDRIRDVIDAHRIRYVLIDSVGFACDGPPEASESALKYLRATRSLGVGSLHLAHVSKADTGDQKPFGSAFWANGARMTWFIQASDTGDTADLLTVGLFNRKANLSKKFPPLGFTLDFQDPTLTRIDRTDLRDVPDLVLGLSLTYRILDIVLRDGLTAPDILAERLAAKPESILRTARRSSKLILVKGADGATKIAARALRNTPLPLTPPLSD